MNSTIVNLTYQPFQVISKFQPDVNKHAFMNEWRVIERNHVINDFSDALFFLIDWRIVMKS